MKKTTLPFLRYVSQSMGVVIGVVLIWRGIWYILDMIDQFLFGSSHIVTAILGILIGLAILYFPDKDLKEIRDL